MTLPLEDFSADPDARAPALSEAARLAAFEAGYAEGWEDALKDAVETRDRVRRALSARLEDLSFTYHEAREATLSQLREVIAAVAEGVLPRLVADGFGARLADAALGMAAPPGAPVTIAVAPAEAAAVRSVLEAPEALRVDLVEDPELEMGQAVLTLGSDARRIDAARLAEKAAEALRAHLSEALDNPKEVADG
ncbi:flagellar assembly protein FliH [Hasllibacter halocynthiae]|uniref:Flagellar assembly protein FliH n=1 Tax=Hasllibacter halocynthiae TaxID=595589 RepID=A0A2T0X2R1_9RHOB|nr:hypothetical protein [Hasllibacter halocynthiae]PRY93197.1 flagellar assembly protein FliH [Hasllibacter halocynthiae]